MKPINKIIILAILILAFATTVQAVDLTNCSDLYTKITQNDTTYDVINNITGCVVPFFNLSENNNRIRYYTKRIVKIIELIRIYEKDL